ncbi:hypothetical protein ERO13_D13G038351v2 [Gossypium hirsutum]|uniref:Uncharacterized protein n=1 Tax=Gossypium darwinii TaxID=34276 RepID=A0A5D1ZWY3_GOSDA|nr:hypothetical protein ERO13_D13G038351v2 [Gossypium hirsutum]TYG36178.1 hypothetical protein ES288_D13G044100v1 [Gossypium darwinii]
MLLPRINMDLNSYMFLVSDLPASFVLLSADKKWSNIITRRLKRDGNFN